MVCTLAGHRNDIRMVKTQVEPRTTGNSFQCKVLNILMSILWWIRLQTMENRCRFVFTITLTVLTSISIEVSWNNKLCHHHVTSMVCNLIKHSSQTIRVPVILHLFPVLQTVSSFILHVHVFTCAGLSLECNLPHLPHYYHHCLN